MRSGLAIAAALVEVVSVSVPLVARLLGWGILLGVGQYLPPPFSSVAAIAVAALFLHRQRLCGPRAHARAMATIRWRPVRPARGRLLGLAFGHLLFVAGTAGLLARALANGTDAAHTVTPRMSTFALCVTVPLLEEAFFRGWMMRRFEQRFSRTTAAIVTALIFALLHLQVEGLIPRFALGITAALAMYLTRSLWAAIFIHAVNNSFAVGISWLDARSSGLLEEYATIELSVAALVLGVLVILLAAWEAPGRKSGKIQPWHAVRGPSRSNP